MTATSDTNEMTEYADIENATAEDIREGDRVTFTNTLFPASGEIRATAYTYFHDQGLRAADFELDDPYVSILRVERPVPALPTRPWALVVPKRWGADRPFLFDGVNWADDAGNTADASYVREMLASGTHYVAFEGVES